MTFCMTTFLTLAILLSVHLPQLTLIWYYSRKLQGRDNEPFFIIPYFLVPCGHQTQMPQCVMEAECQPVQLEPFVHQVGGHTSVLCFDENTVCKPRISREHNFYETMPDEMKEFTPEYRGVVEVTFHEDSDGYLTLVAFPHEYKGSKVTAKLPELGGNSPSSGGDTAQSDSDSESSFSEAPMRFRMKHSGSIEIEGIRKTSFEVVNPRGDKGRDVFTAGHNPWSLHCHKEQLAKMRNKSDSGFGRHKFILLENVASHFELPCILDLKMGTRQHGDGVSEAKKKSHVAKCEASTSATLGVRLCGMQVYQAHTRRYVCHDKYYGRKLTDRGFRETLFRFLHNGFQFREELVDLIVCRLRQLSDMLSRQNTFRFYSSSLLIMYDGAGWNGTARIDGVPSSPTSPMSSGSSSPLAEHSPTGASSPVASMSTAESRTGRTRAGHPIDTGATYRRQDNSDSVRGGPQASGLLAETACAMCDNDNAMDCFPHPSANSRYDLSRVDVRMIDFAHVTFEGFRGDSQCHVGPDNGYLFGLNNLIDSFLSLKERHYQQHCGS